MKEREALRRSKGSATKAALSGTRPPTMEQLRAMSTDELVRMLMSPEMARPMNTALRQQIVQILQGREGNAFVQRLLGKFAEPQKM